MAFRHENDREASKGASEMLKKNNGGYKIKAILSYSL